MTLTVQRGTDDAVRPRDHPRRRPAAGGRQRGPRRRDRRLRPADRLLRRRRGRAPATPWRPHVKAGRTKLILDLRGNPGGFVTPPGRSPASSSARASSSGSRTRRAQVATDALARRRRDEPGHPRRLPHRRRQRLGERDRRGRAPGHRAGDARRPDVVRQGHRPAVAGADRRGRGVQAHDRPLADPGQALDPRRRADPGRRGRDPGRPARRRRTRRSTRRSRCSARTALSARPPAAPPDADAAPSACTASAHQVRFPGTKGGDVQ